MKRPSEAMEILALHTEEFDVAVEDMREARETLVQHLVNAFGVPRPRAMAAVTTVWACGDVPGVMRPLALMRVLDATDPET